MVHTRTKELFTGAAMLVAGGVYFYLATELPRRGAVDASFAPYVLASAMILLGVLQLGMTLVGPAAKSIELRDPLARPRYLTVVLTLALVAAFIALLRPIGFPFAAALYLFFQFLVLTPADKKPSYGLYAALAIICSTVIFVAFRYGFDLILPAGPLTHILP
jgi:putative tricarboxylic transport membrane protein